MQLRNFAIVRFNALVSKCAVKLNMGERLNAGLRAADAWHLWETHLVVGRGRAGKCYKDWLFSRIPTESTASCDTLDILQGGATLIMRDVVREFLRREFSAKNVLSLSEKTMFDASGVALEDLLPADVDPSQEVELRELDNIALTLARDFFEDMSLRERVAVLARGIGLSLAHPSVEKAGGCRKTMLNQALWTFVKRLADRLSLDFSQEDKETVRLLAARIYARVAEQVITWAKKSENRFAELFTIVEEERGCRQRAADKSGL